MRRNGGFYLSDLPPSTFIRVVFDSDGANGELTYTPVRSIWRDKAISEIDGDLAGGSSENNLKGGA